MVFEGLDSDCEAWNDFEAGRDGGVGHNRFAENI